MHVDIMVDMRVHCVLVCTALAPGMSAGWAT